MVGQLYFFEEVIASLPILVDDGIVFEGDDRVIYMLLLVFEIPD